MTTKPNEEIRLFVAYARADKAIMDRLNQNLKTFKKAKLIDDIFYDGDILPGEEWDKKIKSALEKADIVILLISDDFLASDYCYNQEMANALEYHEKKQKVIIPIIVRYCSWEYSPIAKLQVLPKNGVPIVTSDWKSPDLPYKQITDELAFTLGTVKEEKRKSLQLFYFLEKISNSERHAKTNKWELAIAELDDAITYFESGFIPDKKEIITTKNQYKNEIKFLQLVEEGEALLKNKKLQEAYNQFLAAQELKNNKTIKDLINKTSKEINRVVLEEAKQRFFALIQQGDLSVTKSLWQEAADLYNLAFQIYDERFEYALSSLNKKRIEVNGLICEAALEKVKRKFEIIRIEKEGNTQQFYVTNWEFDKVKIVNDSLMFASWQEKFGILKNGLQLITDFKYEKIEYINEAVAIVTQNEKYGVVEIKYGLEVVIPQYEYLGDYGEELIVVKQDGKAGFIDTNGKIKIPLVYEDACKFSEGIAGVARDGKWGFIDQNERIVIPYQFDDIATDSFFNLLKVKSFFDRADKKKQSNYGYFKNGKIKVTVGEEVFTIDRNGEKVK
jgi:hypothetical protein